MAKGRRNGHNRSSLPTEEKKEGQPLASGPSGIFFFKFSKPWFLILGSGKIVKQ
jgi:hypothetical protein